MKYYLTQIARFFTLFRAFIFVPPFIAWFVYWRLNSRGTISTHISQNVLASAGVGALIISALILIWVILGVKGLNIRTIDHRSDDKKDTFFNLTTKLSVMFVFIGLVMLLPIFAALYNVIVQAYHPPQTNDHQYSAIAACVLLFTCSPIAFSVKSSVFSQLFPNEEKLRVSRNNDLPI